MSAWQAEELLQPITADAPCGENLEDTPLLTSFDAYRVFGEAAPPESRTDGSGRALPAPEWGEIRTRALEALGRSKDLRLLAHLGAALLRTDGLLAFTETLAVAAQWLETSWAGTYPLVDEDAILRRNALNCFADPMAVVDGLRRTPLVHSRQHGSITLRDLDIAAGVIQQGDKDQRVDDARINAAFAEMPLDALETLHRTIATAVASLKRIDAVMSAEGGIEAVPAFEPLSAQLVKAERTLRAQAAFRSGGSESASAAAMGASAAAGSVAVAAVGAIASRQDAIRALDAVATFFKHNEPSSPIPLFLERAKRLVAKDFLEVLADIAPDALGQARSAGGLPPPE